MSDPSMTLQTAVRAKLIASQPLSALVKPDNIRAGSTRPGNTPCIILAAPQIIHLGNTAGDAFLSRVYLDLHVWAIEDGQDMARQIGQLVALALWDSPLQIADTTEYARPSFRYMRDPDPEIAYTHGVGTVEAVIRWQA